MTITKSHNDTQANEASAFQCLTQQQAEMIDEALSSLGDFGEVRLIVERGRLRFLVVHHSYDALKYQKGMLLESR